MKHLRLTILKKTCESAAATEEQWLTQPGRAQATYKLDEAEQHLKQVLNK